MALQRSHKAWSLYERPSKNGQKGILYVQLWDQEKSVYLTGRSTGTRNRQEAERIAKQMAKEYQNDKNLLRNWTCFDWFLYIWSPNESPFLASRASGKGKAANQAHAKTILGQIKKHCPGYFGKLFLKDIMGKHIREFRTYLITTKSLAPSTAANIIQGIKVALTHAREDGYLRHDIGHLNQQRREGRQRDAFSPDEVSRLLAYNWANPAAYLAFLIATHGGLRLGEILALQVADCLEQGLMVRHSFSQIDGLKSPKNGRQRQVPLPDLVVSKIREYLHDQERTQGFLFLGRTGEKPMSPSTLNLAIRKAMEACGISRQEQRERLLGFHALRHSCNTSLRRELADNLVQKLIGHSSVAMTNRYDHLQNADLSAIKAIQESRAKQLHGMAS